MMENLVKSLWGGRCKTVSPSSHETPHTGKLLQLFHEEAVHLTSLKGKALPIRQPPCYTHCGLVLQTHTAWEIFYGLLKLFLKWYGSVVDLQRCVSAAEQSDSVIHAYVSVLFRFFSLIACYRILNNGSPCSTVGLFCVRSCAHVNLKLLIHPSPLFHLETIIFFSMSVGLFLFCKQVHLCHFFQIPYI